MVKNLERTETEKKIIQKVKDVSSQVIEPVKEKVIKPIKEYAKKEIKEYKEYATEEIEESKTYFKEEITKFQKSDRYNLGEKEQIVQLDIDKAFLNYQDTKNSNEKWVLTQGGYEHEETTSIPREIGVGLLRGFAKLAEGIGGGGLAVLEKLDLVGEGTVTEFGEFFKNNVYTRIGETETLWGGFAEGFAQFLPPGMGYYKLFGAILKTPAAWNFIQKALMFTGRALAAEVTTVGTAQVPGDPNFVSFISQVLKVDTSTADNIAKEVWNYLAELEDYSEGGYTADDVFSEKLKAMAGDAPAGIIAEALFPLFGLFFKGVKKLKGKPEVIKEIDESIPSAGSAINPDSALGIEMKTGFKVGENLEFKGGQGLPKIIKTEADLKKLKIDLEEMAIKGEAGKLWYEKSGQKILKMFNNDKVEAEKFVKLIALYSPNSAPKQNTAAALKAWYQFKRGTKIKAGMPELDLKAHDLLYNNKDFAGYKSNNFYTNLMKVIDPALTQSITTDRWMLRAFGHTTTGNPTKPQLKFIEKTINDISKKLNWEPEQVQAAIWNTVRSGGDVEKILKTSIDDFATAVDNNLGQISWETAPGRITNHFSEYHTASSIIQNEYHVALSKSLIDESGTDIIAKRLGLVTPGQFDALGVYTNKAGKIEFNPSIQTIFVAPKKTGTAQLKVSSGFDNKGALTVDATNTINAYSFIKGKLLHQEAVAWHRPTFNVQKGLANGMEVSIKLDKNQFKTLVAALDNEFTEFKGFIVPIGTEDGFRIINNSDITGISIPAFQERALKVLNDVLDLQPNNIDLFNTQTGYIITNGSNAETIESIAKGSQDLQILIQDILSELQPNVDTVYAKFAEKYKWTSQAIEGSDLSKKSIVSSPIQSEGQKSFKKEAMN